MQALIWGKKYVIQWLIIFLVHDFMHLKIDIDWKKIVIRY